MQNFWTMQKHKNLQKKIFKKNMEKAPCKLLKSLKFTKTICLIPGSDYFSINNILPLKATLPRDICDWSILMMN